MDEPTQGAFRLLLNRRGLLRAGAAVMSWPLVVGLLEACTSAPATGGATPAAAPATSAAATGGQAPTSAPAATSGAAATTAPAATSAAAAITMVIFDQGIEPEAAKLGVAIVNQDEFAAGIINGTQAATVANKTLGKKEGVIGIGNGNPGSTSIDKRQNGSKQGIEDYNKA